MDQTDWVKVIDHTHYYCRSWQYLYFEPRVVQYVRIVGTHNTVNKVFHVVAFEAVYVQKPFIIEKGIVSKWTDLNYVFYFSVYILLILNLFYIVVQH